MKISLGYYDKDGKKIRRKTPKPNTSFYLAVGTIKKKIRELEDTTPYQVPVSDNNINLCDKKRMIIEILFFDRGRFSSKMSPYFSYGKQGDAVDKIRNRLYNIKTDLARNYKIKTDNFHYK